MLQSTKQQSFCFFVFSQHLFMAFAHVNKIACHVFMWFVHDIVSISFFFLPRTNKSPNKNKHVVGQEYTSRRTRTNKSQSPNKNKHVAEQEQTSRRTRTNTSPNRNKYVAEQEGNPGNPRNPRKTTKSMTSKKKQDIHEIQEF